MNISLLVAIMRMRMTNILSTKNVTEIVSEQTQDGGISIYLILLGRKASLRPQSFRG